MYVFETGGSTGVPKSRLQIDDWKIDVAYSGKTLCTIVLVIAQFRPQQITTTANNMSAVGRDRE